MEKWTNPQRQTPSGPMPDLVAEKATAKSPLGLLLQEQWSDFHYG